MSVRMLLPVYASVVAEMHAGEVLGYVNRKLITYLDAKHRKIATSRRLYSKKVLGMRIN